MSAQGEIDKIVKSDDLAVQELGVTHEQIASRIEYLIYESKRRAIDKWVTNRLRRSRWTIVDNRYMVSRIPMIGELTCPICFGEMDRLADSYSIENIGTGEKISIPALIVHLIRAHHFYLKVGSPYRLDPRRAVRVLEIK